MSWKERRLISILGAILGVLVIALLIVLGIRFRKNRDVPDASSSSAVIQCRFSTYSFRIWATMDQPPPKV